MCYRALECSLRSAVIQSDYDKESSLFGRISSVDIALSRNFFRILFFDSLSRLVNFTKKIVYCWVFFLSYMSYRWYGDNRHYGLTMVSIPHQSNWDVLYSNGHITVRFDEARFLINFVCVSCMPQVI